MFSLKLLGVPTVADGDRPLVGPTVQRRRLALLAVVAASPDGRVSRDRLIGCFWPDTDPEPARRFVADSIYTLRKALGPDAIRASADVLQLDPAAVRCDVVEFRRAIACCEWEKAVTLYQGPFLDGFSLPGATEFEQWADAVRADLARLYADALEHLARGAASRGEHAQASSWWHRLQVVDPLNSRVALDLMMALAASGNRAAALRHAGVHDAMLRDELGIGAGPAIIEFAEQLRSGAAALPRGADAAGRVAAGSGPANCESADLASIATASAPQDATFSAPVRSGANQTRRPHWPVGSLPRFVAPLAVMVLVGAVAVLWPRPLDRPRVLVAVFENRTGDAAYDPFGRVAADWIARRLMDTERLDVISPTWTVYEHDQTSGPRATARRAGARTLIWGAYYRDGSRLRFEAQMLDPVRGSLLHALESVDVPADSGIAAIDLLGRRVATAAIARLGGPREQREITTRARPPLYGAYLDYMEGVRLFSQVRMEQAAQHLDRAWALDSSFHLAGLYRALAASSVGQRELADSLIQIMADRRSDMAAFDRSLLDALQAGRTGDHARLLRAMREVAALAPGSQFVIGLAVAAIRTNRPREALRTLERLAPDVALVGDNPRFWDWLTISLHLLGDHQGELQQAGRARTQPGSPAAALIPEIRALAALGRIDELERLLDESLLLPVTSPGTPADLMETAAAELRAHGHEAAAARLIGRAAAWYEDAAAGEAHRVAHARTLYEAGRWEEARTLYEQLATAQPANIGYIGRLGTIAARRGDHIEARRIAANLASTAQPLTHTALLWRARIAAQLGEHEQSVQLLAEALGAGAVHGMWIHTDSDLEPLRKDPAFHRLTRPRG